MTTALPIAASQNAVVFNPQQEVAINKLVDFLSDHNPFNNVFLLSGFAGTGKTFCMREVRARLSRSRSKFAFTAPTNKAAKELRKVTGEACTIYSLLGLRIDKSGELKKIVATKEIDLSEYEAIFIDEGSMINQNLVNILVNLEKKIVFMGDKAQLPPVGEPFSPIWKLAAERADLTQVMRHDNQILTLVTAIRETMFSIAPTINIRSDNADDQGVWKMTKAAFKHDIYQAALDGEFADGAKSKVIAWRNVRVAEYNKLIRHAIFGAEADSVMYFPGDRIVAAAPCMRGEDQLMSTDEEALVESAVDCQHPMEPKYKAIELKCRTEDSRTIRLLVLHPDSQKQFEHDSTQLAHEAKGNGKLWKRFWDHQDLFHQVKYAYALTAHRSQGSTYENVWVDYQDILCNRNRQEAFQCLYVACSRPTTRLKLA